jgi:TatD DNase family protein
VTQQGTQRAAVTPVPKPGPVGASLPEPGAFDGHTHMDVMGLPVDGVLADAHAAGIHRVVNAGCDLPSSRWGVACAEEYPSAYAAVAIHPNSTTEVDGMRAEVLAELARLAASSRVVAIGETGLDYYWKDAPPEVQQWWFRAHIALAKEAGKALMIHDREAHADVLSILAEAGPWPPDSVIFHCFSGDAEMAARCAEAGYVMSFAGNVTFKNAASLQQAAVAAPASLILCETDAPYMTPVPHRGKPNSPAMTAHTVRFIAGLKGMPVADFCAQLQATGSRVFHW